MTAPAEITPSLEAALDRASRELAEIAKQIARLEILLPLVASAVVAK